MTAFNDLLPKDKLICPGCYEEITNLVGTTSTIAEGIEGLVVYHTECDPIQSNIKEEKK